MKYKIQLLFYIIITGICKGQEYQPSYQSNQSLEFSKFISGVKFAYILLNDEDVQYIVDYPNSGNAYAILGLISYLEEIGFEDIKWGTSKNMPQNFESLCYQAIVSTSWGIKYNRFTNITLSFITCKGDIFKFSSSKEIWATGYTDIKTSFHNIYMKMYGYNKGSFLKYNRLSLSSEMTEWTEEMFKNHLKEKGADPIEGIYESALNGELNPKYRLGVIKTEFGYTLIYFGGAMNYEDWKIGEVKAKLFPTATPTLFKANWYMASKDIYEDAYITFEKGIMNLIMPETDKTLYIKLYPTSDDITTPTINKSASGSGFAVSSDGLIVTNHHVVNGTKNIKVKGINGDFSKAFSAKIIIEDKNNDLALIKIDDPNFQNLGEIPFVITNKSLDVGNSIFVLGYPLRASMGDEIKLTNGIISSKSGFQGDVTSYQISAPVQPGNSGGPLFDDKGNIIGIINAKHTGAENASYAVKASYLINLINLMTIPPKLQTVNVVAGKPLTEQVKILKKFTYIVEVN